MAGLKGGVELDEVDVVELVHHLNLVPHHFLSDKIYKKNEIVTTLHLGDLQSNLPNAGEANE